MLPFLSFEKGEVGERESNIACKDDLEAEEVAGEPSLVILDDGTLTPTPLPEGEGLKKIPQIGELIDSKGEF